MLSIIVAFPKIDDAKSIKNTLIKNGYEVNATCTTGAQVIGVIDQLDGGIVISGYRLPDMYYYELNNYLPKGFEMLLIASPMKLAESGESNIVCLSMPLKINDLLNTLQMMTYNYTRRRRKEKQKGRTEEERAAISKAKQVLMVRNNMTEEEAHRYIQKNSMDSGVNMVEMAEMILNLL